MSARAPSGYDSRRGPPHPSPNSRAYESAARGAAWAKDYTVENASVDHARRPSAGQDLARGGFAGHNPLHGSKNFREHSPSIGRYAGAAPLPPLPSSVWGEDPYGERLDARGGGGGRGAPSSRGACACSRGLVFFIVLAALLLCAVIILAAFLGVNVANSASQPAPTGTPSATTLPAAFVSTVAVQLALPGMTGSALQSDFGGVATALRLNVAASANVSAASALLARVVTAQTTGGATVYTTTTLSLTDAANVGFVPPLLPRRRALGDALPAAAARGLQGVSVTSNVTVALICGGPTSQCGNTMYAALLSPTGIYAQPTLALAATFSALNNLLGTTYSATVAVADAPAPAFSVDPVVSLSRTSTATRTSNVTVTKTPSYTASVAASPSVVVSPTLSPSISPGTPVSPSPSTSLAASSSVSPSSSPAVSQTVTPSFSPCVGFVCCSISCGAPNNFACICLSASPSVSLSVSPSVTQSTTASSSVSASTTLSRSVSASSSLSTSVSPSASASASASGSGTASPSVSPSRSASASLSGSRTQSSSLTGSVTVTPTNTPSVMASPTVTVSPTTGLSVTPSRSASASVSPSITLSVSQSPCFGTWVCTGN